MTTGVKNSLAKIRKAQRQPVRYNGKADEPANLREAREMLERAQKRLENLDKVLG
ncbi:MAG: hypothetical protein WAO09_01015 [Candidatus Dormiibacterota bacterium]